MGAKRTFFFLLTLAMCSIVRGQEEPKEITLKRCDRWGFVKQKIRKWEVTIDLDRLVITSDQVKRRGRDWVKSWPQNHTHILLPTDADTLREAMRIIFSSRRMRVCEGQGFFDRDSKHLIRSKGYRLVFKQAWGAKVSQSCQPMEEFYEVLSRVIQRCAEREKMLGAINANPL